MYGDEDFERELEKAYREGRREERERMEEHYGYGERGGYGSGSGSGSGSTGSSIVFDASGTSKPAGCFTISM